MGLTSAGFVAHTVAGGGTLELRVQWQSTAAATLHLNYNTDEFTLEPHSIAVPANNAGNQTFPIKFHKHTQALHCDVNFVFGASDDLTDSVDVT